MARPIAVSAAPTVNINKAKICPKRSSNRMEKNTKFILADNKISSKDIKIIIIFFLSKNIPRVPIKNMLMRIEDITKYSSFF